MSFTHCAARNNVAWMEIGTTNNAWRWEMHREPLALTCDVSCDCHSDRHSDIAANYIVTRNTDRADISRLKPQIYQKLRQNGVCTEGCCSYGESFESETEKEQSWANARREIHGGGKGLWRRNAGNNIQLWEQIIIGLNHIPLTVVFRYLFLMPKS